MRERTFAALMAALLLASPVAAQEQRGAIEGLIHDTSGAVLPGATVVVKGPLLPAGSSTVTDGGGYYRFPGLPTGVYEVTATLQGFVPARVENVGVALGQIKKV